MIYGVSIDSANVLCLLTAQAHYRHTDRRTDGRKSDLNSAAYYATLAKNLQKDLDIFYDT